MFIMKIDADALKNFQNSKFNFVTDNSDEPNYDNLDQGTKYIFRIGDTVVQDQMSAQAVVNTINNEWGEKENV